MKADYESLCELECLSLANAKRPLYLFLDSLDQIDDENFITSIQALGFGEGGGGGGESIFDGVRHEMASGSPSKQRPLSFINNIYG